MLVSKGSLIDFVAKYNAAASNQEKAEHLIQIIDQLIPVQKIKNREMTSLETTPEMDSLFLGDCKMTKHPVFQACTLLMSMSTELKAESEQVVSLAGTVDQAVSHYFQYALNLRFEKKEAFEHLVSLVSDYPSSTVFATICLQTLRFCHDRRLTLSYNETAAEVLLKHAKENPYDLERVKLCIDYFLKRKNITVSSKDLQTLVELNSTLITRDVDNLWWIRNDILLSYIMILGPQWYPFAKTNFIANLTYLIHEKDYTEFCLGTFKDFLALKPSWVLTREVFAIS